MRKNLSLNHYKTTYFYEAGEQSIAKRIFGVNALVIENEFILPHTTIARVKFGTFVSTVITFATPVSDNKSRLFVKTYRNFWENPIGDMVTYNMMQDTMSQDKVVVEGIDHRHYNGKFNMRYDKLQNTYITLYNKMIYNRSSV